MCLRGDGEELELPVLEKGLQVVVLDDLSHPREEGAEEVRVTVELGRRILALGNILLNPLLDQSKVLTREKALDPLLWLEFLVFLVVRCDPL